MPDENNPNGPDLDALAAAFQADQAHALSQDGTREDVAWVLWTETQAAGACRTRAQESLLKALRVPVVALGVLFLALAARAVLGAL